MTLISSMPSLRPGDLERLEHEGGVEFVNGKLVGKPLSAEAARIISTITRLLGNAAAQSGLASVFNESLAYRCFAEDATKVRKPDVSVMRKERLVGFDERSGFMPIPADLAVEVLSPTDRVYDVGDKVEEYLQNGFGVVWVVDPNARTTTVNQANSPALIVGEEDDIGCGSLLPTFRHKVKEFFAP